MIKRHNHIISFLLLSITVIGTSEGWANDRTKQTVDSVSTRQKGNRHVVSIDIESSGTIITENTKFTADSPQRSKKLSRAVSAYGEEMVADIRPAKYTPMKHVYDVLKAIAQSGCYTFMLEGREYEIPAKVKSSQRLALPIEVLVEVGPPVKNPATGKAVHAGIVIVGGLHITDTNPSALTEQLRPLIKAAEASQSKLLTNILSENETLYGRVVHVLDACAEAGINDIVFSYGLEPRDYSAPEKVGRNNRPTPGLLKRIVSESSKSKLVMPEISGFKSGQQKRSR